MYQVSSLAEIGTLSVSVGLIGQSLAVADVSWVDRVRILSETNCPNLDDRIQSGMTQNGLARSASGDVLWHPPVGASHIKRFERAVTSR